MQTILWDVNHLAHLSLQDHHQVHSNRDRMDCEWRFAEELLWNYINRILKNEVHIHSRIQILRVDNHLNQVIITHSFLLFFFVQCSWFVLCPLVLWIPPNRLSCIFSVFSSCLFISNWSLYDAKSIYGNQSRPTWTAESISIFFISNCLSSYWSILIKFFFRSISGSTSLNFSLGVAVAVGRSGTLILKRFYFETYEHE